MTCFLQDILDIYAPLVSHSAGGIETANGTHVRRAMCSETLCTLRLKPKRGCLVLWLVLRNLEVQKCSFGCFVASHGHVSFLGLGCKAWQQEEFDCSITIVPVHRLSFSRNHCSVFSEPWWHCGGECGGGVEFGVVRGCWRCRNTSTARRRYHHVHPPLSPHPPFFSCSYPFSLPFPFGMFSPMSAIL